MQLTADEKSLIAKYLDFYVSLDTGTKVPTTPEQRHFIRVCQCRAKAETVHEIAYIKHRMLATQERAESQNSPTRAAEIDEYGEGIPRPGWFTDADWKRMRGQYLSNSD